MTFFFPLGSQKPCDHTSIQVLGNRPMSRQEHCKSTIILHLQIFQLYWTSFLVTQMNYLGLICFVVHPMCKLKVTHAPSTHCDPSYPFVYQNTHKYLMAIRVFFPNHRLHARLAISFVSHATKLECSTNKRLQILTNILMFSSIHASIPSPIDAKGSHESSSIFVFICYFPLFGYW